MTPLMMAITNNQLTWRSCWWTRVRTSRAADWYGRTPLWAAVEIRNLDRAERRAGENGVDREAALRLITSLLDRGVDVNARVKEFPPQRRHMLPLGSLEWVDFTGQTAFIRAAQSADVPVMRLLLSKGADPEITTFNGTTALMAAAGVNWVVGQTFSESPARWLEAVQLCLELGGDVNAVNEMGLAAVHGAANRGSDDIIELLAPHGAKLDMPDKEGRTPLVWAKACSSPPTRRWPSRRRWRCSIGDGGAARPVKQRGECGSDGPTGSRMRGCSSSSPLARVAVSASRDRRSQGSRGADRPAVGPPPRRGGVPEAGTCVGCHNTRVKSGGLALEALDPAKVDGACRGVGEGGAQAAHRHDAAGGRAEAARRRARGVHGALEAALDRVPRAQPDPGAPALHRLNRTEYANAIRDLLALDVDVSALLPPDDSAAGFDNIADVLGVSPALIEGYASAAAKISRLAMGDPSIGLDRVVYRVPGDFDRTRTSKGCRSARAAASSSATRSRSTPSTTCRSGRAAAHVWADRRRGGARGDDL